MSDNKKCVNCGAEYKIEQDRPVCKNGCNHPDGKYHYLCKSDYCRCKQ